MPTGYTHKIANGITFNEFVLGCARAFGACVTMRDDTSDAPIPEAFEPSPYYAESLANARKRLKELKVMTLEEITEECESQYKTELRRYNETKSERINLRQKYEAMLEEVFKWEPPTPDHHELQRFMVEQLKTSIDFDCNDTYILEPENRTPDEWLKSAIASAKRDIKYYTKERDAEKNRVDNRNTWIKQLRESLKESNTNEHGKAKTDESDYL